MINKPVNIFPRKLSDEETVFLNSVLPENKPGYNAYRKRIGELVVIGYGRFSGTNLILGNEKDVPDLSISSSPVFAAGNIIYDEGEVYILIHEEEFGQIEFDISTTLTGDFKKVTFENKSWNYSEWNPGNSAPNDNGYIREVTLLKNSFLLALAPSHKKIWVHDYNSGVNHFIPSGIFYNELMSIKGIRESKIVLNYSLLFDNVSNYTDNELISAFISYNKLKKRFKFEYVQIEEHSENKSIFEKGFWRKKKK
jgi:hypothetical protein